MALPDALLDMRDQGFAEDESLTDKHSPDNE
jgi:hypothetical protein